MSSRSTVLPVHLLLLPPTPWPVSSDVLNAAYAPAVLSTLTKLKSESQNSTTGSSLDVALPIPYLYCGKQRARGTLYSAVQKVVAGLYKLICVIAAKNNINVEDTEGIDVRVILLAYPRDGRDENAKAKIGDDSFGPVIDLQILASSKRPWKSIFAVESEQGEHILRQFLNIQDSPIKVNKVKGGVVQVQKESDNPIVTDQDTKRHDAVANGGTWDHIHIGHKLLLTMTAFMLDPEQDSKIDQQKSLTIGITGDELLKNKKYAEVLQGWEERQNSVVHFLRAIMDFAPPKKTQAESKQVNEPGPNGHAVHTNITRHVLLKGVEINDPFGPTITDETISALIVSGETRSGGKAVNDKRNEKGWLPLEVFEVDVLDAQDIPHGTSEQENPDNAFQSKLSSTSIRQAIKDRGRPKSKA